MITVISSASDWFVTELIYKALIRSFSRNQVQRVLGGDEFLMKNKIPGIFILINPEDFSLSAFPPSSKIIIFGALSESAADQLAIQLQSTTAVFSEQSHINFRDFSSFRFPIPSRPLIRYDFLEEWNNLGYGGISAADTIWSIAQTAESEHAIATIDQKYTYISLHDFDHQSILWVNRQASLIDSVNWQLIEYFVSAYRFEELFSLPYLLDIPGDVEMAATMRLDCDEDISSARQLFDCYRGNNIPFSLAVKTSLPIGSQEISFLSEILKNKGAVLSHSVNHKVAWGDDYCDAYAEAFLSKTTLQYMLNHPVDFSVSPFHSNTIYSIKALEDANYKGFVSGIIANDPEYLMSRGGAVPFANNIVSHSQQCMLHGDCLLEQSDPMAVYKQAFDYAHSSQTLFGYLDHPFSSRYQYGWESEAVRIQGHQTLIDHMRSKSDVLFMNENQCLQFMIDKSNTEVMYDQKNTPIQKTNKQAASGFPVTLSLNQQVIL